MNIELQHLLTELDTDRDTLHVLADWYEERDDPLAMGFRWIVRAKPLLDSLHSENPFTWWSECLPLAVFNACKPPEPTDWRDGRTPIDSASARMSYAIC